MQIKNGTVKYPAGKVFQSDWGERQNIVVEMDDGSTEKLYFAAGRQPHASLKRGESVQVLILLTNLTKERSSRSLFANNYR